jgi:hypothetical protein
MLLDFNSTRLATFNETKCGGQNSLKSVGPSFAIAER